MRLLICLLLTLPAYAAVIAEMHFQSPEVAQGELVETRLEIQETDGFELQKLRGQTYGKTIYFYDVSPMMKREGSAMYEADAKVIFIKVPDERGVQEKVAGKEVNFLWGDVKVNATEPAQTLIFGNFSVPEKAVWMFWLAGGLLLAAVLGFTGWKISGKLKKKRIEKERRKTLKDEILGARNYDDVVNLWKRKHLLFLDFPHIQEPFEKLEAVLNRYQFKPKQSEAEKIDVVESYRKFSRSVEGGFNGV